VRNFTHAHRIVEFFREQASSATPGEAENIVLVVVGTGHLFCNDKLPASHPSVPKILATLGVTAGSTFAVEPGEKVDCNINPVTGAVSAEIVKLEAEKK